MPSHKRRRKMAAYKAPLRRPTERALRGKRHPVIELLEDRRLMAGDNTFAQFVGEIVAPGGAVEIPIVLAAQDFAFRGGSTLVGFHIRPGAGALDPQAIEVRGPGGQVLPSVAAAANLPNGRDSLALVDVGLGAAILVVRGEAGSVGGFLVDVFLVGDADGNHIVERADADIIRAIFGAQQGEPSYDLEADANLDGRITSFDLFQWQVNSSDLTQVRPLDLSVQLSVDGSPLPGLAATAGDGEPIVVSGSASPLATVELDLTGDGVADMTKPAGGDGAFSFNFSFATPGLRTLALTARDSFGQRESAAITLNVVESFAISSVSPGDGDRQVSVDREAIIRFSDAVDPATINANSLQAIANGKAVAGRRVTNSTHEFVTFFPDEPWPSSTEIRLVVNGDQIKSADGDALDANGDGASGGTMTAAFRTLPLTRIAGTNVSGRVVSAFRRASDGSPIPLAGVTIRVDGLPNANAVTNANGEFTIVNAPAPVFFVHIDGTTATGLPAGITYPSVGKPFMSVPGQSTVMSMGGVPFDISLPPISAGDIQDLSPAQPTTVGFGAAGIARLQQMFPNIDPAKWSLLGVTFEPNSARDKFGNAATEAVVIPVPPDRLPGPLPPGQNPLLVISVNPLGATNFDVPAPLTFPNIEGLPPGERSLVWSFDHDAGEWKVVGTTTVSADGSVMVSNPGEGFLFPGWHFVQPGGCGGSGGAPPAATPPEAGGGAVVALVQETNVALALITGQVGSFPTLTFTAPGDAPTPPALDPGCDVPQHEPDDDKAKLTVTIEVDGPLDQYMTKREGTTEPLGSSSFTLVAGSGDQRSFGLDALSLQAVAEKLGAAGSAAFPLSQLNENVLFGSKIKVTEKRTSPDGATDTKITNYFLYRYVDATDANHEDGVVEFEDTLVGLTRTKPVQLKIGESAQPNLFPVSQPFTISGGTMNFAPKSAGINLSTELLVQAPSGDLAGVLTMRGDGQAPQRFYVNLVDGFDDSSNPNSFLAQAKLLFNNGTIQNAERELFGFDNGSGMLEFNILFARAILEDAVARAMSLLGPFAPAIDQAVTPDNQSIVIGSFVDTGGRGLGETVGMLDNNSGIYTLKDVRDNRPNYSAAERGFRLSEALNEQPAAQINVYLRKFFIAHHNQNSDFTREVLVNALGKTFAHEIGHAIGLTHTNSRDQAGLEVMTQFGVGHTFSQSGFDLWEITDEAAKMALGLIWTQNQADEALDYYARWLNTGEEGAPGGEGDENHAAPEPIPDGLVWPQGVDGKYLEAINYGNVDIAAGPVARQVVLANIGDQPATLGQIVLPGGTPFAIAGLNSGQVIPAGGQVTFTVTFDPAATGAAATRLSIANDGLNSQLTIPLSAFGRTAGPRAVVAELDNNLGGVRVAAGSVSDASVATIVNHGAQPLTISAVQLVEGQAAFSLTGFTTPVTLPAGGSLTIGAVYDATRLGLERGIIKVTTNDPTQPTLTLGVVGTGLATIAQAEWGDDFVQIDSPAAPNLSLRTRSNLAGNFSFALAEQLDYHLRIYDPTTGLIAHGFGTTAENGHGLDLTKNLVFAASVAADSDFDGLPDDVEVAIGTGVSLADTDQDGLQDFFEIQQGLDPFGGMAFPTGVIAATSLDGEAKHVVVVGETDDPRRQTAYVATGFAGLALVDATQFDLPIVLGQIDLEGDATDVAIDASSHLAVVAANAGGVHIVDVSDPMIPQLVRTIAVGARTVEVIDGIAYVGVGTQIRALDIQTGEVLQTIELMGAGVIAGLAAEGATLYAFANERLFVIDAALQGGAAVVGQVAVDIDTFVPPDVVGLSVGAGMVFIAADGITTVNVSNPAAPTVISTNDSMFVARLVAANGSGLALSAAGARGVELYDISNPAVTNAFLAQFDTLGSTHAVAIASGIGFAADGSEGLLAINYAAFDVSGQAPTASISAAVSDVDPAAPGIQVVENSRVSVAVAVADDVQVRNVELLVNGVVVSNDVSFPFDQSVMAPPASAGKTLTIQVRATDTGGNTVLSNMLAFDSVPDKVPPTIISIAPASGATAGLGVRRVEVRFSEPIAASAVNLANFELRNEANLIVTPLSISTAEGGRLVRLRFNPLDGGVYTLRINSPAVTDVAGNALGAAPTTSAFTISDASNRWINLAGGDWDVPANWSLGRVPLATDSVVIDLAGTYAVEIEDPFEVATFRLGGASGTQTLVHRADANLTINGPSTIAANGVITIDVNTLTVNDELTVLGRIVGDFGSIDGTGSIDVAPAGIVTLEGIWDADIALTNQGTLNLDGTPGTGFHRTLVNQGTINVKRTMEFSGGFTNAAGATLRLAGNTFISNLDVPGGFTNFGTIELSNIAAGTFNDVTLESTGGTITNAATGVIVSLPGPTAAGAREIDARLVNLGTVLVQHPLTINDSSQGNQFVQVSFDSSAGVLDVAPGRTLTIEANRSAFGNQTTLKGGGTIDFDGTAQLQLNSDFTFGGGVSIVSPSSTLTVNGPGSLLNGGSLILDGSDTINAAVVNSGTLLVHNFNNRVNGAFANAATGLLRIASNESSADLMIANGFSNFGTIELTKVAGSDDSSVSPTLTVTAGTLTNEPAGSILIQPGQSERFLDANLANSGFLAVGSVAGPADLLLGGSIAFAASSKLDMFIGGTAASLRSEVFRTESTAATLSGTLNVSLLNNFVPALNNTFRLLSLVNRSGQFAAINGLDVGGGLVLQPQYDSQGLTLRAVAAAPVAAPDPLDGDFDVDGDVDGNDFLKWQRELGATAHEDLSRWRAGFAHDSSPAIAVSLIAEDLFAIAGVASAAKYAVDPEATIGKSRVAALGDLTAPQPLGRMTAIDTSMQRAMNSRRFVWLELDDYAKIPVRPIPRGLDNACPSARALHGGDLRDIALASEKDAIDDVFERMNTGSL